MKSNILNKEFRTFQGYKAALTRYENSIQKECVYVAAHIQKISEQEKIPVYRVQYLGQCAVLVLNELRREQRLIRAERATMVSDWIVCLLKNNEVATAVLLAKKQGMTLEHFDKIVERYSRTVKNNSKQTRMKAILNVPKTNKYSRYNGWEFPVIITMGKGTELVVKLAIDGRWIDFKSSEVIITNLQENLQRAYDSYNCNLAYGTMEYRWLLRYMDINKIVLVNEPHMTFSVGVDNENK